MIVAFAAEATAAGCLGPTVPTSAVFADLDPNSGYATAIQYAVQAGLITSCGDGYLCPFEAMTREDMAVWAELFINGPGFSPPAATGIFEDVPATYCYACWIEDLYSQGLVDGCSASPARYCPHESLSRAQMAVFILSAMDARSPGCCTLPTQCSAYFEDVPCSHWAWPFIEKVYELGITSGCYNQGGVLRYCPDQVVTRVQMATFLAIADYQLNQ